MSEKISASGLDSFALFDIAHVEMGQSPDSRYVVEDPFQGLAFLQGNAEFGAVYPEPKFGCLRPAKQCNANDVLISVRAPVGAINVADRDYCIGRGLAAIRGRGIKSSLLGEVIARQSRALRRVAQGTTFEAINKKDLLTLKLSLPPKTDWPQIAEILDTLDTAIHETEAIIAKLKGVKQGLLHDLLTRGIDANGELRPPQAEAPHLFKDSPLGWIPKEWDAGTIGNYLDAEQGIKPGPFGSSIKKESYSESGFKVYGQEQVIGGDQEIGNYFVPLRKFQELQDFAVEVGDVLISLVGTIGKVLVLKKPLAPGLINPRLMRLRPDTRIAHSEFIGFLISSDSFVRQVIAHAGGGTMPVINKRIIAGIRVPVVPSEEQQEILKRRSAVDQRISWESAELEKLKAEKSGLMEDLLTGRVSVTPLLAEAAQQPGSA